VLEHIRGHCEGVRDALRRAEPAGVFLSAGPIRPGVRQAYRQGVFRLGNAAGEAHPVIAEGISMAIQSAWLLCRRLTASQRAIADERDTDEVGAAYAKDWAGRFAPRVHAAAALAHLAMRPSSAALAASVAQRIPQLLTWGARISGKTLSLDMPSGLKPAGADA
jgi:flavin-dependent dehydrogenase